MQMRKGEFDGLAKGLKSTVFRRRIGFYAPCFASTLMIVVLLRLGGYECTRRLAEDGKRLAGHRENHPQRYEGLGEQVWELEEGDVGDYESIFGAGYGHRQTSLDYQGRTRKFGSAPLT